MPRRTEQIDKSAWTWKVVMRRHNEFGGVISEEQVGIPFAYDRAVEVYKYKSTREVRTGVTYFVAEIDSSLSLN